MKTPLKNFLKIISLIFVGYIGLSEISQINQNSVQKIVDSRIARLPIENWQDSEPGKFAHALQYEDKLPKPVPYQFKKPKDSFFAKGKLTDEEIKLESESYFEHLCNTESGNYVWETVGNVDYIAFLRLPTIPLKAIHTYQDTLDEEKRFQEAQKKFQESHDLIEKKIAPFKKETFRIEEYLSHRNALEDPAHFDMFISSSLVSELQEKPERIGLGKPIYGINGELLADIKLSFYAPFYIDPFKDRDYWYNNGTIAYYKEIGRKNEIPYYETSQQPYIKARYGVTWRGFIREKDRELGIAGGDLIIVDLKNNNKVMAVQRVFAKANINYKKNIISWNNPLLCPEIYKNANTKNNGKYDEKTPFPQKLQILKREMNDFVFQAFTIYVLKHNSFIEKKKIAVNPNIKIKQ